MDNKPLRSSDEEIDLLYYLKQLGEGMKKLGGLVKNYFKLLWSNMIIFILIVIVITGAAFSLRYIIPPAYRTNGIFISHFLTASYYELMIKDIDELLKEKNIATVAEHLHLSTDVATQILRIELEPLRDTALEGEDIFAPFRINLLLKETNQLNIIQEGILFYLEGGELENVRKQARAKSLEEAKVVLLKDLNERDSIGSGDYAKSGTKGGGNLNDSAFVGKAGRAGFQELLQLNARLANLDKIEVVRPFLKRQNSNYPNYGNYLICGFLISILLAMIITPFAGRRKKAVS
ncbi:MAG TPA: hypothetical protein VEV87_02725 [Chitinophagaceae bacterium]|nr:hypothetical protein [Chitinophagaceae bacterium]